MKQQTIAAVCCQSCCCVCVMKPWAHRVAVSKQAAHDDPQTVSLLELPGGVLQPALLADRCSHMLPGLPLCCVVRGGHLSHGFQQGASVVCGSTLPESAVKVARAPAFALMKACAAQWTFPATVSRACALLCAQQAMPAATCVLQPATGFCGCITCSSGVATVSASCSTVQEDCCSRLAPHPPPHLTLRFLGQGCQRYVSMQVGRVVSSRDHCCNL